MAHFHGETWSLFPYGIIAVEVTPVCNISQTCWGCSSVLDHLASMCKALGSIPSTGMKKKKFVPDSEWETSFAVGFLVDQVEAPWDTGNKSQKWNWAQIAACWNYSSLQYSSLRLIPSRTLVHRLTGGLLWPRVWEEDPCIGSL
jgi:hypothetical protein